MDNQMSSKPSEPVRAGYDAPRAERLGDAARASGGQCEANGSGAMRDCADGAQATSCLNFGNYAQIGCSTGEQAHECGAGNYAD
jgi:hypothetical protein